MTKKVEYPPMSLIPPFHNPTDGRIYDAKLYKDCIQVEFNKDGSADTYDYASGKHLKHYKN